MTVMALTGLQEKTESLAAEHDVPGVAVGIFCDGEEHYAYHGVTSAENPLAVGPSTLFQVGSITKTYTATATMRLAEAGEVGLDDPVRTYVPELRLKDEAAARTVTVGQLLNHSVGRGRMRSCGGLGCPNSTVIAWKRRLTTEGIGAGGSAQTGLAADHR